MSGVNKGSLVWIKCPSRSTRSTQHTPPPAARPLHHPPFRREPRPFCDFRFSRMPTVRTTFRPFSKHATHRPNCRVIKLGRIWESGRETELEIEGQHLATNEWRFFSTRSPTARRTDRLDMCHLRCCSCSSTPRPRHEKMTRCIACINSKNLWCHLGTLPKVFIQFLSRH